MTEAQLNAALEAWLAASAGGPGQNNATLLALDAGWNACTTNAARVAFLSTYAPISALWLQVLSVVNDPVFWVGIDMIMNAVLKEAMKLREAGE